MADFWRAAPQERQQRPDAGCGAKKMGESVGPLAKLHHLDSRLVENYRTFEDIHGRRIHPGTQEKIPPTGLTLTLDHGGGGLAGEPGGVEQVVVMQRSYRIGPLQGGESGFHGAAEGIVKCDQPRRFSRPKDEMGESFRPVKEGSDNQRRWLSHTAETRGWQASGVVLQA